MKTSAIVVPITLCIFCVLLVTVSSATIKRRSIERDLSEEYRGLYEALQQLANQPSPQYKRCSFAGCMPIQLANKLYQKNRHHSFSGANNPGKRNFADFQQKKAVGGCDGFGGCASLKAGRDLARVMFRQPSKFGANSPGKK